MAKSKYLLVLNSDNEKDPTITEEVEAGFLPRDKEIINYPQKDSAMIDRYIVTRVIHSGTREGRLGKLVTKPTVFADKLSNN